MRLKITVISILLQVILILVHVSGSNIPISANKLEKRESIQQLIYINANENLNEKAWALNVTRQAKRNPKVVYYKDVWKCNLFVYEIILVSGLDIGTYECESGSGETPPVAGDWYNYKSYLITNNANLIGEGPEGMNKAIPGDIITDGIHMGIYAGDGKIINAGPSDVHITDTKTTHDWGNRYGYGYGDKPFRIFRIKTNNHLNNTNDMVSISSEDNQNIECDRCHCNIMDNYYTSGNENISDDNINNEEDQENNNRKLKRFCKKYHSLDMLDKNKISDKEYSSMILLSNSTKFDYNKIENLIVFGDSHSFAGTDFETMKFSKAVLSNRRNWPLQLTDIHNMTLWNFATNGATVSQNITYRKNYPIDFIKQYELFHERMSNGKKYFSQWNSKNTLFTIYMGSNDIFDIHWINNNKTINENLNDIINVIFDKVENAYNIGLKNYLILNLSPFEKAPIRNKKKYKNIKSEINYFNSLLVTKAEHIFKKHNDINIIIFDTNKVYNYIINHYKAYDFKSGTEAWSPTHKDDILDNYFWRDYTHISNKANKILAEYINDLLNSLNH